MKISLRKANMLQSAINEVIASLDLTVDVKINEFEQPTDKVESAVARFTTNNARRAGLLDALYAMRDSVSNANTNNGINTLLATVARTEKDILLLSKLCKLEPAMDKDVIIGKLGKIKGRTEDYYGREDIVMTNIFDAEHIQKFKDELVLLKKTKVASQDKLLELNVRTEIELSDTVVELLKAENLL